MSVDVAKLLSRHIGKTILVITAESTGYEGKLKAVSANPALLHLEDASRVVLRSTIIDPIPRVTSREKVEGGEVVVNLANIYRIELSEKTPSKQT